VTERTYLNPSEFERWLRRYAGAAARRARAAAL